MKKGQTFAICVSNENYEDLATWKVYRITSDAKATAVGCLRVVDESGEDYLYPSDRFVSINLSNDVQEKLLSSVDETL